MAESPGAMQLRTLQTIDGLGPTASNTVVLAVPIDILQTVRALGDVLTTMHPEPAGNGTQTEQPQPAAVPVTSMPASAERLSIPPPAASEEFAAPDRQPEPVRRPV
jgi:hypothetical protein